GSPFATKIRSRCGRPVPRRPATLVQEIAQPELHLPARQQTRVVDERLRRAGEVEYRSAGPVETHQLERRRRGGTRDLAHPPRRIQEMPHVQDVETQLEPVTLGAGLNGEFLQDPEVHVVVPRIRLAEPVRDLTAVRAEVAVLV